MNIVRCFLAAMLATGCASKATSTSPPFLHRANDLTCANPPDRPNGGGGFPSCETDSDCIAQNVTPPCLCGVDGGPGLCASGGNCATDEQCPGGWCSPSIAPNCGEPPTFAAYYCRTLDEPCHQDSDCDGGGATCSWNEVTGNWTCQTAVCCCG